MVIELCLKYNKKAIKETLVIKQCDKIIIKQSYEK